MRGGGRGVAEGVYSAHGEGSVMAIDAKVFNIGKGYTEEGGQEKM